MAKKKTDTKLYQILSYVGILWIIGLLVPEKEEKDLKFHVGQGIILTIAWTASSFAVSLINSLVIHNIFQTTAYFGYSTVSGFGLFLYGLLSFAVAIAFIILTILGIVNANSGQKKELPIIGKYAFYK